MNGLSDCYGRFIFVDCFHPLSAFGSHNYDLLDDLGNVLSSTRSSIRIIDSESRPYNFIHCSERYRLRFYLLNLHLRVLVKPLERFVPKSCLHASSAYARCLHSLSAYP